MAIAAITAIIIIRAVVFSLLVRILGMDTAAIK